MSSSNCPGQFVLVRTYRATDDCGNFATCTQTITVSDTSNPRITCQGFVTVSCAAAAPPPDISSVVVSNNCAEPPTVTWEGDALSTSNCPNQFILTRTYKATDRCGNSASCIQLIIVSDTNSPILTKGSIANSYTTVTEAESAALDATDARDDCSPVTKTVSTTGECNATITVTGADSCGNRSSVIYTTCISAEVSLAIVRSGASATVSWPFPSTGYVLESTTSLSSPNWQQAAEAPANSNGRREVTVTVDKKERYFRLRKP
jgi:hypothetical protein